MNLNPLLTEALYELGPLVGWIVLCVVVFAYLS